MKLINLRTNPLNGYTYLEDKDAFNWYCAELDVNAKYRYRHCFEPAKYPCLVTSAWWDDLNGPYTYNHSFAYPMKKESKCEACGHKEDSWFWQLDE